MKTLITFHILLLIVCSAVGQSTWQESDYNKYTYQTITNLPSINDTIVPERFDYKLLNAAVFYETNRQRALYGLKPLKHDSRLENCAQGHSQDMVSYNFFSHRSTVPGKYDLPDRTKKFGISGTTMGENISDNFLLKFNGEAYYPPSQAGYFKSTSGSIIPLQTYQSLAAVIVDGWMHSPGHKANILNSDFTHLGVGNGFYFEGVGIDRIPRMRSTQNFARLSNPFFIALKPTSNSYNRYSQPSSTNYKSHSSTQLNTNQQYKYKVAEPEKKSSRIGLSLCVAGVANSLKGFTSEQFDYQITGQLGGYVGEKGHGRSFWGVFPSVDLTDGYPFALECGTVLSRFVKFSAGARMLPNDNINQLDYTVVPSATVGIQLHLWILFASLDCNGFYRNGAIGQRFIASAGICF